MGNIALVIFLGLFGFMSLVHTDIPSWVLGAVALVAAVVIGFCGVNTTTGWWKRAP
jgi:xanthine/uracil permease